MSKLATGPFVLGEAVIVGSTVRLGYSLSPGLQFFEEIEFPFDLEDSPAMRRAVKVLHLVAGVSYYKCAAPTSLHAPKLTADERALVTAIYDEGLREFAYRNAIAVPLPVDVISSTSWVPPDPLPDATNPSGRGALVPLGGGKDSALVAHLIPDGVLMAVNPVGAHEQLAAALGRPLVRVRRRLSPLLRELVEAGAPNGHVPVTAINSAVAGVVAVGLGLRDVVMGLERSASEPSLVTADGVSVNHQFSKSAAAEALLQTVLADAGLRYFSLLRGLTELGIGVCVANLGLADEIVSCNRVFTIWRENESSKQQRPCGECDKCLFTALMLAPGLSPEAIAAHFGGPLLDSAENTAGVQVLWADEKPFDCVGERLESAAAVGLLASTDRWREQAVIVALGDEARALLAAEGAAVADYLAIGPMEAVPAEYQQRILDLAPILSAAAPH